MPSDSAGFLLRGDRVGIRHVTLDDYEEISARLRESVAFHRPWIPRRETTRETFAAYVARCRLPTHEGFVICRADDGTARPVVGAVNVNDIVRGSRQSGVLGYVAYASTAGRGYMTEGVGLVVRYAFEELGLHRLEANVQPDNGRSARLVERLGFRYEGHSPAFQLIDGEWRDHDRWAITAPESSTSRPGT